MNKTWKVFIPFHKNIIDDYYLCDKEFDSSKYTFVLGESPWVSKGDVQYNRMFGYNIITEREMAGLTYQDLQTWPNYYKAGSVLYHAYKNRFHEDYDFVGFLEYKYSFNLENAKERDISITDSINCLINTTDRLILSLDSRRDFKFLASQKINHGGKQVMTTILNEYNLYHNTSHTIEELEEKNPIVPIHMAFIMDRESFKDLAEFISYIIDNNMIIDNGAIDPYDILQRYIGLYIALYNKVPKIHITLQHHWRQ
jgi:hypothetical protein